MDKSNLSYNIAVVKTAFPAWQADPALTLKLWELGLSDLDKTTLDMAVLSLVTETGRAFAPSVGEIRGAALRLYAQAAGIPTAWQAYDEVVNMPASMERYEVTNEYTPEGARIRNLYKLKFSHPLVELVARLLGWPRSFPTDMPGVDRSQFVKAYESELERSMDQIGQPPAVAQYVEHKRLELKDGKAPEIADKVYAMTVNVAKKLERV